MDCSLFIEHCKDTVDDDDYEDDDVDDDDVEDYPAMSLVYGLFTQQVVVTTNMRKTIIFNPVEDGVEFDVGDGIGDVDC